MLLLLDIGNTHTHLGLADDRQVLEAMRFAYEELRMVVEPGGAVGLAALLANPEALRGRTAVVVASGGNVDTGLFMRAQPSAGDRVAA